jgi:hypothetical protein
MATNYALHVIHNGVSSDLTGHNTSVRGGIKRCDFHQITSGQANEGVMHCSSVFPSIFFFELTKYFSENGTISQEHIGGTKGCIEVIKLTIYIDMI